MAEGKVAYKELYNINNIAKIEFIIFIPIIIARNFNINNLLNKSIIGNIIIEFFY